MNQNIITLVIVLACWFIPIFVQAVGESAKTWIISSNDTCITFRKPVASTIGWVLMALLYPASFLFCATATKMNPSDRIIFLSLTGALALIFGAVTVYAAVPKTVVLDLRNRTCFETKGWLWKKQLREQKLTEAARLLLCWTSNYHSIFLQTALSGDNSRFLLSMSASRKNVSIVANELSQRLSLPIVEGPLSGIRSL